MEESREWQRLASAGETKSQAKVTSARERGPRRSSNIIARVSYMYLHLSHDFDALLERSSATDGEPCSNPTARSTETIHAASAAPAASPPRACCLSSLLNAATPTAREPRVSGARNSRKVSLLENLPVMQLVSRGDVSQRPYAHLIFVRRASSQPHLFAE